LVDLRQGMEQAHDPRVLNAGHGTGLENEVMEKPHMHGVRVGSCAQGGWSMGISIRSLTGLAFASLAVGMLLSGTPARAARVQDVGSVERIDVTDYGIYTAEKSDAVTKGKNPRHYAVENVAIVSMTDTVQALPRVKFGLRYRIIGQPLDGSVTVRIVVKYPPQGVVNPKTGILHDFTYTVTDHVGGVYSFAGYSADETWELVPGVWTLQLWVADKMYVEKAFTMVPKPSQEAVVLHPVAN